MSETIHPHGKLRELAPGLHVVEGRFGRSPMGRRMSVVASEAGLLLHSAMRLDEEQTTRLDALGPVRWVLAPNGMHASEAPWYAERYPEARVLVPEKERAKLSAKGLRVDGTVEQDWPEELAGVLDAHPIAGLRIGETALHHPSSRSLIVNDLCMHYRETDTSGWHRAFMRFNGVYERLAPSKLLRWVFLKDRAALKASLEPVLALDVERVVVSHGSVLESGGQEALRSAFAFL